MFNKKTDHPRGSKKLIGAWTWYDWANSVYSLVISLISLKRTIP